MSFSVRAFFLGVFALAIAACGGPAAPSCGPENCEGCCTSDGVCAQPTTAHCGQRGDACQTCGAFESCMIGSCVASGNSGTSTSGGSTATTTTSSGGTTTGGTSGWTTTTTTTTSSGSGSTTGGPNGPPTISSLSANPTTLSGWDSTTISAIVSDPDGLSDLSGGVLKDPSTGQTYGAFSTPGGQGTFTYSLTWDALNAMSPLTFPAGGGTRAVEAVFYDNHGHTTAQQLTLTLRCSTSTNAICGGSCVDLSSDSNNCGSCGNAVASGGSCSNGQVACPQYQSVCNGACVDLKYDKQNCGSCGTSCYAWASQRGVPSSAVDCDWGSCVAWTAPTTEESCAQACAAMSSQLSCDATQACYNPDGSKTAHSYGGCATYNSTYDGTCQGDVALGCNDVPAATLSSCGTVSNGTQTGNFASLSCLCH